MKKKPSRNSLAIYISTLFSKHFYATEKYGSSHELSTYLKLLWIYFQSDGEFLIFPNVSAFNEHEIQADLCEDLYINIC